MRIPGWIERVMKVWIADLMKCWVKEQWLEIHPTLHPRSMMKAQTWLSAEELIKMILEFFS